MQMRTWWPGLAAALLLAGCAKNKPPEIDALIAFPNEVGVGDTVNLLGRARDPERGKLTYSWTCKDGNLSAKGDSTAVWTTPNKPGTYKVTFAATDPKGAKVDKTVEIKVLAANKVYSGSLNAPGGDQRKQRAAPQTRKGVRGTHAPKTTK